MSGMKLRPSNGSVVISSLVDVEVHRPTSGLQQRGFGLHRDRLRILPQFELHVELGLISDTQRDAHLCVGPEPRLLNREHVPSGTQPKQVILAALVGGHLKLRAGALLFAGYLYFRHPKSGWILKQCRTTLLFRPVRNRLR